MRDQRHLESHIDEVEPSPACAMIRGVDEYKEQMLQSVDSVHRTSRSIQVLTACAWLDIKVIGLP